MVLSKHNTWVICPYCAGETSSSYKTCDHCGLPLSASARKLEPLVPPKDHKSLGNPEASYRKSIFGVLVFIGIMALLVPVIPLFLMLAYVTLPVTGTIVPLFLLIALFMEPAPHAARFRNGRAILSMLAVWFTLFFLFLMPWWKNGFFDSLSSAYCGSG